MHSRAFISALFFLKPVAPSSDPSNDSCNPWSSRGQSPFKVAGVFGTWRASQSEGPRRWVRSPRSYFVQQGLRLLKGSCGVFTACRWAVVKGHPTEAWSRGVACRIVLMELDTRRPITQNKVDFIWGLCWVPGSDEFFTDNTGVARLKEWKFAAFIPIMIVTSGSMSTMR